MEASRSRSPIWTVSPPRSAGSTSVRRSTVDPAIASTRVRISAVSSVVRGTALVTVATTMPRWALSWRLNCSLTPVQVAGTAALDEQAYEPQRAGGGPGPRAAGHHREALGRGNGRAVDDAARPRAGRGCRPRSRGRRASRRARRRAGRPRRPPPRSARAAWWGVPSACGPAGGRVGEELGRRACAGGRRHGFADDAAGGREGEVGDLSPELGDGALALRLDLARSRARASGRSRRGWPRCPVHAPPTRPSGRG